MKKVVFAVLFCAMLFAQFCFGQASDGNIVGTVVDVSGAVVPNANVELLNLATGVKNSTTTDSAGSYRFGNVPIGTYTITVSAPGFTTTSLKNVQVELSKTTTANLTVQVGTVSSTVEVSAAVALIDTTTAQVSNTFQQLLATDLPMAANPNGGVYNLALIGAGVA